MDFISSHHASPREAPESCVGVFRINVWASEGTQQGLLCQVMQELAEILYKTDVIWNMKQNASATKQTQGLNKQNKPIV